MQAQWIVALFAAALISLGVVVYVNPLVLQSTSPEEPTLTPDPSNLIPAPGPQELGEVVGVVNSFKPPFSNINAYAAVLSSDKPEAIVAHFAESETGEKTSTEVTVYNSDLALVKELRTLSLEAGLNLVRYKDIASRIIAESVLFNDLTSPDTFVVEQNYQYDLVSTSKILEKYLDSTITAVTEGEKVFTGTLLSHSGTSVVLQTEGGVVALSEVKEFQFPELPEGLLTKPTLVWQLFSPLAGEHETQTTYLTNGLSWRADYVAEVNQEDNSLALRGWVTTTNTSGTSYPGAKLKLVAGDVHRVSQPVQRYYEEVAYDAVAVGTPSAQQFGEEGLFEYHLYTLERTTDLANNETKQISLLSAPEVAVEKKFIFDDWENREKVQVKLDFTNTEEKGLGIPLPKGIVRVYKADSDGQLQFLGEDRIDHTPKNEDILLLIGNAFDVTAEKTQLTNTKVSEACTQREMLVELKNAKDEAVEVIVVEHVSGDARILNSSVTAEKKDAFTFEFTVTAPADGETELTYTVESCFRSRDYR